MNREYIDDVRKSLSDITAKRARIEARLAELFEKSDGKDYEEKSLLGKELSRLLFQSAICEGILAKKSKLKKGTEL